MKNKYIVIVIALFTSFSLNAQGNKETQKGTSRLSVVFNKDTGLPIKAYADATDYIHFMYKNTNKPYFNQEINLHYKENVDTTKWQPNKKMLQDNIWNPEPLDDKFLAKDSVCIVMQEHFDLADRAYTTSQLDECIKYADSFRLKYYKVLYLYRDKTVMTKYTTSKRNVYR